MKPIVIAPSIPGLGSRPFCRTCCQKSRNSVGFAHRSESRSMEDKMARMLHWPSRPDADAIVAGSAIFGSTDYAAAIARIRNGTRDLKSVAS